MRKIMFVKAALAASACFPSEAMATDMYDPSPPMLEPPSPTPLDRWTGFSLGAGLGGMVVDYGMGAAGTFDADTTTPATIDTFSISDSNTKAAIFGTAHLGYDRQFSSGFVVGVFADADFSGDTEASFSATTGLPVSGAGGDLLTVSGTTEVEDTFTLGGRLGFLANPSVLIYGLLGWTHADINVSGAYSTNIGGSTPIVFSQEDALDALSVGAGIETLLSLGFSLKFEYRYTDLGDLSIGSSLATLAGVTSDGASAVDVNTDMHTVRVVLTWRPGM